jgi:polyhydroxyalkanoate synthase
MVNQLKSEDDFVTMGSCNLIGGDNVISNIDKYLNYSQNYTQDSDAPDFEMIFQNDALKLFRIGSSNQHRTFLIVPSIINGPEVLYINYKENLLKFLQNKGSIFIIKWKNINSRLLSYNLDNYIAEISAAIAILDCKVELIGHCLGGILSLAVASQNSDMVRSLVLLTTPWDFAHFKKSHLMDYHLLGKLEYIPAILLEYFFFLLDPDSIFQKFQNFNEDSIESFIKIERWLHSGNDIPTPIFMQLLNFMNQNILLNQEWDRIDFTKLKMPICMVGGKYDKIAPISSSSELLKLLSNSHMIELNSGHIGFLFGKDSAKFYKLLENWLVSIE